MHGRKKKRPYPTISKVRDKYRYINDYWERWKLTPTTVPIIQRENYHFFENDTTPKKEIQDLESEIESIFDKHDSRKLNIFLADLKDEVLLNIRLYEKNKSIISGLDFETLAANEIKEIEKSIISERESKRVKELNKLKETKEILKLNWFKYVYEHSLLIKGLIKKYQPETSDGKEIDATVYIVLELHDRLIELEKRMPKTIDQWKKGIRKIECAAFCELLFEKKYFVSGSTRIKDVNSFSLSRYGVEIKIQLQKSKEKDRKTHKIRLNKFFT